VSEDTSAECTRAIATSSGPAAGTSHLSIVKGSSGEWAIGELFTSCNKRVKVETESAVNDWLSNAQIGI
jgi:hypothetical protein